MEHRRLLLSLISWGTVISQMLGTVEVGWLRLWSTSSAVFQLMGNRQDYNWQLVCTHTHSFEVDRLLKAFYNICLNKKKQVKPSRMPILYTGDQVDWRLCWRCIRGHVPRVESLKDFDFGPFFDTGKMCQSRLRHRNFLKLFLFHKVKMDSHRLHVWQSKKWVLMMCGE